MEEHPQSDVWRAWLRGEMEPEPKRAVGSHLRTCDKCRAEVAVLGCLVPHPSGADAYEMPIRWACNSAVEAARQMVAARLQAARELDGFPIAAATPQLTWARAEAFLAEARGFRRIDAELAKQLALAAEVLARKLDPANFPPGALVQLQADCGVEVANSLRIAGDLAGAKKAFARAALAVADLNTEQIDPDRGALRAEDYATFLIASRRHEEAAALLEDLAESYLVRGQEHAAGRVFIRCAVATAYRQVTLAAARFAARGLRLIDRKMEPKLLLAAMHNLIGYCSELGAPVEAAALLRQAGPLYERFGEPLDGLKGQWLAGRIAAKRRSWFPAEAIFGKLRRAYRERDLPFHEALVTLELAVIWLAQTASRNLRRRGTDARYLPRPADRARGARRAHSAPRSRGGRGGHTLSLIEEAAGRLKPIAGWRN